MIHEVRIKERNIPDAWRQTVTCMMSTGDFSQETGRWEINHVHVQIRRPGERPLIPELPHVTMEIVERRFHNITSCLSVWGRRIVPQMEEVVRRFRYGPGWGLEYIIVTLPSDLCLDVPPRLHSIGCQICRDAPSELYTFVSFRRNDLWTDFPVDMATMRLLQEHMAKLIGVPPGNMAFSIGEMHLSESDYAAALQVGQQRREL